MPSRVLITETLSDAAAKLLAQHAEVVWCPYDSSQLDQQLAQAEGLVVRTYTIVNESFLDKA
ncbi:MAG: hypothetical protein D6698_07585, partial [Gammaproteobacteria bacterium]